MAYPQVILGDDGDKLIVKLMLFKKGDEVPPHRHKWGHHNVLHTGAALYLIGGQLVPHRAPALIWIEANVDHQIVATEEGTQCSCIHDRTRFVEQWGEP